MDENSSDEEMSRYHLKRGKALWAGLPMKDPPMVAISSIDWHLTCAMVYVRLAELSKDAPIPP